MDSVTFSLVRGVYRSTARRLICSVPAVSMPRALPRHASAGTTNASPEQNLSDPTGPLQFLCLSSRDSTVTGPTPSARPRVGHAAQHPAARTSHAATPWPEFTGAVDDREGDESEHAAITAATSTIASADRPKRSADRRSGRLPMRLPRRNPHGGWSTAPKCRRVDHQTHGITVSSSVNTRSVLTGSCSITDTVTSYSK